MASPPYPDGPGLRRHLLSNNVTTLIGWTSYPALLLFPGLLMIAACFIKLLDEAYILYRSDRIIQCSTTISVLQFHIERRKKIDVDIAGLNEQATDDRDVWNRYCAAVSVDSTWWQPCRHSIQLPTEVALSQEE